MSYANRTESFNANKSSSNTFANLSDALRDTRLEIELGLSLVSPDAAQRAELIDLLNKLTGSSSVEAYIPRLVLTKPLTDEQRSAINKKLEPIYAAAIFKDEQPREKFEFTECGESMVDLVRLAEQERIEVLWSDTHFHSACGPVYGGKPRIFWLRKTVAEKFVSAARALNQIGLLAKIEDCFRPKAVQAGLYLRRYNLIKEEHPDWSEDDLLIATQAKTASAPYRAAHMSGAAIDFTLYRNPSSPAPLDLGNPYPTGGAATYLKFPYVTWEQSVTRSIFEAAATSAGLTVYLGEDWHASDGDTQAALARGGNSVRYCAIQDFDRRTGEILPLSDQGLREPFSVK